jgi:2-oxo-4-hydroxy-4-carboxy-5-ureidoimidazoline decarboxylase
MRVSPLLEPASLSPMSSAQYEPKPRGGQRGAAPPGAHLSGPSTSTSFDPRPRDMAEGPFVARFGGVYEHSPWIAAAVYRRGLTAAEDTPEGLSAAMAEVLAGADAQAQLALIRAHPDLAGRAAIAGDLTDSSQSEQSGAGLDRCTPEEYRRFQELNAAYNGRFGFPFILAVAGRGRWEILEEFERRIGSEPAAEFQTALAEINKIARLRLDRMAAAK